jgi:hypothetical protein
MNIGALLDKIKKTHNVVWDRQMAAMLKVKGRDVTQWRAHTHLPELQQCRLIAQLSGEAISQVLYVVAHTPGILLATRLAWGTTLGRFRTDDVFAGPYA